MMPAQTVVLYSSSTLYMYTKSCEGGGGLKLHRYSIIQLLFHQNIIQGTQWCNWDQFLEYFTLHLVELEQFYCFSQCQREFCGSELVEQDEQWYM